MSFFTSSAFLSLKAFQTAVSRTTNASLSEMAIAIIVVANKKTIGYAKYFFISVFVVATALCRRAFENEAPPRQGEAATGLRASPSRTGIAIAPTSFVTLWRNYFAAAAACLMLV